MNALVAILLGVMAFCLPLYLAWRTCAEREREAELLDQLAQAIMQDAPQRRED